MPIETVFAFLAAALFLAFVPGPDNLFVLTQAALRGRRAGLTMPGGDCVLPVVW